MLFSSFDEMQKAVDIVNSSPHPTNKIAATIFGTAPDGKPYSISKTNFWPEVLVNTVGTETRIGNSSGTIHAETACIAAAEITEGASLCVTDPFCPNCAKNMAEAGIRTIYIDHKGFDKDFSERRGDAFKNMSMQICEKAGINVYEIRRKEQKLTPILEIPESYKPPEDNPIIYEELGNGKHDFSSLLKEFGNKDKNFAAALTHDLEGKSYFMLSFPHLAPGYRKKTDKDEVKNPQGKYSFTLEPINRILMNVSRHGLTFDNGYIFSAHVPTSREQVNMLCYGLKHIYIGDKQQARDEYGPKAMQQLTDAGIMSFGDIDF